MNKLLNFIFAIFANIAFDSRFILGTNNTASPLPRNSTVLPVKANSTFLPSGGNFTASPLPGNSTVLPVKANSTFLPSGGNFTASPLPRNSTVLPVKANSTVTTIITTQSPKCQNILCLNGGFCVSGSSVNARCQCVGTAYGSNCQYVLLNSTIFKNSTILSQELSIQLLNLVGFPLNLNSSLIYQASKNSFTSDAFHSRCDSIFETFIVVKTMNSNVFGGFTQADWSAGPGFVLDSNAFIFSLINQNNTPVVFNLVDSNYAIFSHPMFGPVFGGGFDFSIANQSNSNMNSFSKLGQSYQSPNSQTMNFLSTQFLAGSFNFQVAEIEVYSIDPCWHFICKNGGQCLSTPDSVSCQCTKNSYGNNCEYIHLNSSIFKTSTILNQQQSVDLLNMIGWSINSNFTLIYQASVDGFDVDTSQQQFCSANNLVLFKTQDSYVFGGYRESPAAMCSGKEISENEFIFSLINLYGAPVTMSLVNATNDNDPFSFGADIAVDIGSASAYSDPGTNFQVPFNMIYQSSEAQNFLAGSQNTDLFEVEIYQLDLCSSFPCQNNGICQQILDMSGRFAIGYNCKCIKNWYGQTCQYYSASTTKSTVKVASSSTKTTPKRI